MIFAAAVIFFSCTADFNNPTDPFSSGETSLKWEARTSAGQRNWASIVSSADGISLAAVDKGGYIYTSTDSGQSWTEQTASGKHNWHSIASSSDGTHLSAVDKGGYIYTSTDSGQTWLEQTASGQRNWHCIASSSDGIFLAAVEYEGYIYTSANSGSTWTQQTAAGSRNWISIVTPDGHTLAAVHASIQEMTGEVDVSNTGFLYVSYDGGASWIAKTDIGAHFWISIVSGNDWGASCRGDSGYLILNNTMGQWSSVEGSLDNSFWKEVKHADLMSKSTAESSDGSIYAVIRKSLIYISTSYGNDWSAQHTGEKDFVSIAMSTDGSMYSGKSVFAAVVYGGYIYTAEYNP